MAEYELLLDPVASKGIGGKRVSGNKASLKVLDSLPPEGEEVEVELRDPRLMESFRVRAIFSSNPEELPGSDVVWLVRQDTGRFKEPWAVKILEKYEDEASEVKAISRRKPSLGQRKGHLLADLLKQREEKMAQRAKGKDLKGGR